MSIDLTPLWDSPATAQFWPDSYDRVVLDRVDSTMAEAMRMRGTAAGPVWIMASEQTDAHGRRGRPWAQKTGNFAATLLMPLGGDPAAAALRSFSMSIAVRQTLAMTAPADQLALKWPNDVLLGGGKVAGILLEAHCAAGRMDWLSIGVGVNLVHAPDVAEVEEGAVRPVAVSAFGSAPTQQDFLFWLASHFAHLERLFQEFGFEPVRKLWLLHAARLGDTITARLPGEDVTGRFDTLDENGYLVLNTAKGPRSIAAADVYF